MKTTKLALIVVTLNLALAIASGQGTVNFANQTSILSSPPDRLVRFRMGTFPGDDNGVPGGPVSSNAYGLNFSGLRAQLFYGAVATENSLVAVTTEPAQFRGSTSASVGCWFGGTRTLTGFNPGNTVFLQVRVWDISIAPDWNAVRQPGYLGLLGLSAIFTYTIPTSQTPAPADFIMQNFQGFYLYPPLRVPEPTVAALLGLAALCFTVRRTRRCAAPEMFDPPSQKLHSKL